MAYFPLFVNLDGKHVLVVGGGKIATRRVRTLLEFGCTICVLAPEISEEMKSFVQGKGVTWIQEPYCGSRQLSDRERKPFFVLAAALAEVNHNVVEDCHRAGIPVNDAAKKENCDFYFPGIVKDGDVVVGITTGGIDHKLAASVSAGIRDMLKCD